jgi:hypothetical protein
MKNLEKYSELKKEADRLKEQNNNDVAVNMVEELESNINNFKMGLIYPEEIFKFVRDIEKQYRKNLIK